MGRSVPLDDTTLIHPLLHFSFLAAGFAATIAIITVICTDLFRKKSQPEPPKIEPSDVSKVLNDSTIPSTAVATRNSSQHEQENSPSTDDKDKQENDNNEFMKKELPLPPAMLVPKEPYYGNHLKRVTSERRASFSLSMKMPRSLSLARNWDHLKEDKIKRNWDHLKEDKIKKNWDHLKEDKIKKNWDHLKEEHIKPKLKQEPDSVWMKTIILGEKCVPDEEDDPIIFEGKGKKIAAYHPKSNMSMSRQNFVLEPDALCVAQSQTQEDRMNNNI
ncbi:unnamed protein product [Trifolium pratense]|uniref:Uncharacterized protein n=1 Tax=Trifolium pratense TaxID=57577 RepID=A0ACB0JG76_TRIPR|nr:unnamed protein product [Trifolium pratense]